LIAPATLIALATSSEMPLANEPSHGVPAQLRPSLKPDGA